MVGLSHFRVCSRPQPYPGAASACIYSCYSVGGLLCTVCVCVCVCVLLQVPVHALQLLLEPGYEDLLAALQSLAVLHPVLQGLEHATHARAQRLDPADRMRESVKVHPHVQRVRHLCCP